MSETPLERFRDTIAAALVELQSGANDPAAARRTMEWVIGHGPALLAMAHIGAIVASAHGSPQPARFDFDSRTIELALLLVKLSDQAWEQSA